MCRFLKSILWLYFIFKLCVSYIGCLGKFIKVKYHGRHKTNFVKMIENLIRHSPLLLQNSCGETAILFVLTRFFFFCCFYLSYFISGFVGPISVKSQPSCCFAFFRNFSKRVHSSLHFRIPYILNSEILSNFISFTSKFSLSFVIIF